MLPVLKVAHCGCLEPLICNALHQAAHALVLPILRDVQGDVL